MGPCSLGPFADEYGFTEHESLKSSSSAPLKRGAVFVKSY